MTDFTRDFKYAKTHAAWKNMKNRCNNPNHPSYNYYGARGITYEPAWESFQNFLQDMGIAPGHKTLERKDNNLDYSKENWLWATWAEQATNKRQRSDNKSGVVGVSYDNTFNVWVAHAKRNFRRTQLYRGIDFFEAVCARKSFDAKEAQF